MGAGELMLASLFLYVPGLICEMALEGMAGFLRTVKVSTSGFWSSQGDSGIGAWFNQVRPIPQPEAHHYDMGYQEAAPLARRRSLSDLHEALRRFTPTARFEYTWGAIDALADELINRGEAIRVL